MARAIHPIMLIWDIMNSPEHADAAVKGLKDAKIRGTFCDGCYLNPAWEGSHI
jgi:hypothetical protein